MGIVSDFKSIEFLGDPIIAEHSYPEQAELRHSGDEFFGKASGVGLSGARRNFTPAKVANHAAQQDLFFA